MTFLRVMGYIFSLILNSRTIVTCPLVLSDAPEATPVIFKGSSVKVTKSSLFQVICVEAAESANQLEADIVISTIAFTVNSKSDSSICLAVLMSLDLNHFGAWPSLPPSLA